MTEATNIWTATASEITNAVRESLIAMGCGEPQTGDVYDQLLLLGRSGVEELVPSVSKFGAREFESVMAVVVDLLGGDGIAVHGELPIWLRVYPSVEGKLPAFSVDDWRWIRLSSIQEVGVWGAMEPKTNVSSESHRKGAFRSPAHPPGITL
ncbi:TPA: hypothetical protein ACPWS4_006430 [Pseudomonas aeruginosa]